MTRFFNLESLIRVADEIASLPLSEPLALLAVQCTDTRPNNKFVGSFPFLPPPPSGLFPPPPVEAVAAATSVHVFIH